jgi:tetratricopeptide (TPR) repeat protein
MEHLQRGEWSQALTLLRGLQADYPDAQGLQSLVVEAGLRLETEQRGRRARLRLPALNRRVVFVLLLVLLLLALSWGALVLYRQVVIPSLTQTRARQQQDALAQKAEGALAAQDYAIALELYDQLAALNPAHAALAQGPAQAKQALALDEQYRKAQEQLAAGQTTDAQVTLVKIQATQANYRDVPALLAKIERQQRLTALQRQAAEAKAAGEWEGAILRLEEARALVSREERGPIEAELFQAYSAYAGDLVSRTQSGTGELNKAVEMYNKALALRPGAPEVTTQRNRARQYLAGVNAYRAGEWSGTIAQLEPLYTEQPDYLGGQAAQLLYNAYMRDGDALMQAEEVVRAWERYQHASQIRGVDTTTAQALAAALALHLTPTVTPTPTPTRTPTIAPTLVPTVTPTPGYVSLTRYRGKIVFWSTRSTPEPGGRSAAATPSASAPALWIMDPDGKNAFRIWQQDKAKKEYEQLQEAERRSPDGKSFLYVLKPRGEQFSQFFVASPDGKSFQVTNWEGQQYDPVWSPTGYWIAFVSNETGNDEIYIIGFDGDKAQRLTTNDWEWDKHPSWSPDGTKIVFWSNRIKGHKQIWQMNDNGSYPINLSNNEFEDWDPIWIK